MQRRNLIKFVAATAAWSTAPRARAQQRTWRIGWLAQGSPPPENTDPSLSSFQRGLEQLGYQESRHYSIEARFANVDRSLLRGLAKELVDRGVDIIVTVGTASTHAAKNATSTIPIVMTGSDDPIAT